MFSMKQATCHAGKNLRPEDQCYKNKCLNFDMEEMQEILFFESNKLYVIKGKLVALNAA